MPGLANIGYVAVFFKLNIPIQRILHIFEESPFSLNYVPVESEIVPGVKVGPSIFKIAEIKRRELKAMGYNIGNSQTPIIPIIIGDQMKTMQAWKILFEAGIYTNVALPPAVPPNMSLLRTSYMATHTDEQLEKVLETFKHIKQKLAIS